MIISNLHEENLLPNHHVHLDGKDGINRNLEERVSPQNVFDANHPSHYLALVNKLKLSYAWIESHHNSSETNSSA